jgi:RHS repeat-associated protein
VVASYRYDPYGNTLAQSGALANANTYRFSSKELHAGSGLYYYGYRFYDPSLQRWINRDPIGEPGFQESRMAHAFVGAIGRFSLYAPASSGRRFGYNRGAFIILRGRRTVGPSDGPNAYTAMANTPTDLVDPIGLQWCFPRPCTDSDELICLGVCAANNQYPIGCKCWTCYDLIGFGYAQYEVIAAQCTCTDPGDAMPAVAQEPGGN